MRIGLFGGSFDPIHCGHLQPVLEAVEALALDCVIYLPTGRPPHKPDRALAPALARYAMAELALLPFARLWVSGRELSETAPSYTVDTVGRFRDEHPDDQFHLLIGSDSFAELRSWHRWREIVEMAEIAVLSRGGAPAAAADAADRPVGTDRWEHGEDASGERSPRVHWVKNRPLEVSSTVVRESLRRGERPPTGWVPDAVVDFALKYRLYR